MPYTECAMHKVIKRSGCSVIAQINKRSRRISLWCAKCGGSIGPKVIGVCRCEGRNDDDE